MYGTLGSDTQVLVKVVAVRRVDLQDSVPTGRARAAAEDRETAYIRRRFSFMLQQALSQRNKHNLSWKRSVTMEPTPPHTVPRATEAPPGLVLQ